MKRRDWIVGLIVLGCVISWCEAADWGQWRGPNRDGVAPDSPPLIDKFPKGGPKQAWKNDKVASARQGGYGSVTVVGGFAYVYANAKYYEPFESRTLTTNNLKKLGWDTGMPDDLRQKVEEARQSEERKKAKGRGVRRFASEWMKKNLPKEMKKFRGVVYNRLRYGPKAVPAEALRKVEAIKDKAFPSQKALDAWFAESGIDAKLKKVICRGIQTKKNLARDVIFCLKASTGEVVWRTPFPGAHATYSSSSTPCVVDGRCYVQGSTGYVYCLDAKTGGEIWKAKTRGRAGWTLGSSFLVQDGLAVVLAGGLTALDAKDGKARWFAGAVQGYTASPALWRANGRTYLICNQSSSRTYCVEAKTGKIVWQAPGGGNATPALSGDVMVMLSSNANNGLVAHRLNAKAPEKLWQIKWKDRGSSPVISDGYVYAFGGRGNGRAMCVNLETGKVAWDVKLPNTEIQSPVLADGKIWVTIGMGSNMWLHIIKATPEKFTVLDKVKLSVATATSPALADGKMYLRMNKGVACYDLRK